MNSKQLTRYRLNPDGTPTAETRIFVTDTLLRWQGRMEGMTLRGWDRSAKAAPDAYNTAQEIRRFAEVLTQATALHAGAVLTATQRADIEQLAARCGKVAKEIGAKWPEYWSEG